MSHEVQTIINNLHTLHVRLNNIEYKIDCVMAYLRRNEEGFSVEGKDIADVEVYVVPK
jgi:hypothetical protein